MVHTNPAKSLLNVLTLPCAVKWNEMNKLKTTLIAALAVLAICPLVQAGEISETQKWLWKNSNLTLGLTNTVLTTSDIRPTYGSWGDVLLDGKGQSTYELLREDNARLLANFNINLSLGRTYYITNPFCNSFFRFGFDVKWLSLNFTDFAVYRHGYWGSMTCQYDLGEVSVEAGPSLTMRVYERFLISAYARYAPTAAVFFNKDFLTGSFMNYYVAGVGMTFSTFGCGFERREGWGQFVEDGHIFGNANRDDIRFWGNNAGYRVYIAFRF